MNVDKEVAALQRMTVSKLREKFAEVCGEPTRTGNKTWLVKRIAWRMQALVEGDISERARQRAAELANDADLPTSAPKAPKIAPAMPERTKSVAIAVATDDRLPLPGTILMREYKGQTLQVRVLPHGFEFEGEVYKSLSAVATLGTWRRKSILLGPWDDPASVTACIGLSTSLPMLKVPASTKTMF